MLKQNAFASELSVPKCFSKKTYASMAATPRESSRKILKGVTVNVAITLKKPQWQQRGTKAFAALLSTLLVISTRPRFSVPHFGWVFDGNTVDT